MEPEGLMLSSEGGVDTVAIKMCSVLGEPLAGDLVVMFNDSSSRIPEDFPWWVIAFPVFVVAVLVAVFVYRKKRR